MLLRLAARGGVRADPEATANAFALHGVRAGERGTCRDETWESIAALQEARLG